MVEMNYMTSFESFDLDFTVLRGLYTYGFTDPSTVQMKAIPAILSGRDVIIQSPSGTGKTGAFCISVLEKVVRKGPAALGVTVILCPTRELAIQTFHVMEKMAQFVEWAHTGLCIGGCPRSETVSQTKNAKIIVATPGRLLDILSSVHAEPSITTLVIDEADEMLSKGFIDQIHDIISSFTRTDAQIALFSATFELDSTRSILQKFMNDPLMIQCSLATNSTTGHHQVHVDAIRQYHIQVRDDSDKFNMLMDLYASLEIGQAIVYASNKIRVVKLASRLRDHGHAVGVLHSNLSQIERTQVLADFKAANIRVLVSSDLIARGMDIVSVNMVINYDFPTNFENYIHRIGRCGRFHRNGMAITLVTGQEMKLLEQLADHYSMDPIEEFTLD